MGFYINPSDCEKEIFLKKFGKRLQHPPVWEDIPEDSLPIVLVNNFTFTAVGVAFSKNELTRFTKPEDTRPKKYYIVKIKDLKNVVKDFNDMLKLSDREEV